MDPISLLINACAGSDRAAIDDALRHVPDVNVRSRHDSSAPLHYAAEDHSAVGIRALLDAGAEVDLPDAFGNTALHYAMFDREDVDEATQVLLDAGADPSGAKNRHPDAFLRTSRAATACSVTSSACRCAASTAPWPATRSPTRKRWRCSTPCPSRSDTASTASERRPPRRSPWGGRRRRPR